MWIFVLAHDGLEIIGCYADSCAGLYHAKISTILQVKQCRWPDPVATWPQPATNIPKECLSAAASSHLFSWQPLWVQPRPHHLSSPWCPGVPCSWIHCGDTPSEEHYAGHQATCGSHLWQSSTHFIYWPAATTAPAWNKKRNSSRWFTGSGPKHVQQQPVY